MVEFNYTERQFEDDIEKSLLENGGYTKGDPRSFDKAIALDKDTLLNFVKTSQPNMWKKYITIFGGDEVKFLRVFDDAVKKFGLLTVLRKGVKDRGAKFKVIAWKPESSLNESSQREYEANVFHCTRQLHYCRYNDNSVDIVLFINGIPLVSMELKCQFTGQNVDHAVNQFKFDRSNKDKIFQFNQRVLVHFAVDLDQVFMTTKLDGKKTFFLPFNQGSNGAGNVGGAGNPIYKRGSYYATSYLWEKVLHKDNLLDLLKRYLHLENKNGEERLIFPRYHQLDVVTKLWHNVKENGAGHNYLIQHSAGSGKSNSIAWLAYRLAGLHNEMDEKIFKSVIVVTDRKVLDSQLQDTIYQFDHVKGMVKKIDRNAKQLREAIEKNVPIIITTLQKFPVIYKEVNAGKFNFAIIVDEAHSSQTGSAATKLKRALADTDEILEVMAELEAEEEAAKIDPQDKLINELAAQGMHKNLSFFAFTATPKDRTLNMFGELDTEGRYHPFHLYSMRQAIEEGFILDVLKNYMTYNMYYKVVKTVTDDPEIDTSAGLKAIRRYESLHPYNIAQKTEVMLEHFQSTTSKKIGGKAKAMVVTSSRLSAVRYVQEFKRQIASKGYKNIGVLVAFSGEVEDNGFTYTEEKINKDKNGEVIKESALPEAFHSDAYNILIVAEKYQTGFDEPLLHTMFVDKKLSGVKAVQTLSRLNRVAKGKFDTFVLDFVNTGEDIQRAFAPYYEETILEEATDPDVIYTLKNTLDEFQVYDESEVIRFGEIFYSNEEQQIGDLGRLQALIKSAVERYNAMPEEKRDTFKSTLARFIRIYSFITQVCRLLDKETHVFSTYGKFLLKQLPTDDIGMPDIDDKVMLEYYRLEKKFEGEITLTPSDKGFKPITGDAGKVDRKQEPFSELIEKINKRYGTNFTEEDKVLMEIENEFASQEKWRKLALTNEIKTFMQLFNPVFEDMAVERCTPEDKFFTKLFTEAGLFENVRDSVGNMLYTRLRKNKLEHQGMITGPGAFLEKRVADDMPSY